MAQKLKEVSYIREMQYRMNASSKFVFIMSKETFNIFLNRILSTK